MDVYIWFMDKQNPLEFTGRTNSSAAQPRSTVAGLAMPLAQKTYGSEAPSSRSIQACGSNVGNCCLRTGGMNEPGLTSDRGPICRDAEDAAMVFASIRVVVMHLTVPPATCLSIIMALSI
jgi:hypothetical protein